MNIEIGLRPLPPDNFYLLFKDLPPPLHPPLALLLNEPFIRKNSKKHIDLKRKYKEDMERVHDNAAAFMHVNIKTNS